jgi:hypothetical protein
MSWWKQNNLRMIQTNLREIDATMDVDQLISDLSEFSTNVLMMNAGGIFAFYPTKLQYQYKTPYLQSDLLGEVVEKTHKAGMRFIARFDFSKAHESIYQQKPEWFFRTEEGKEVNYHGIVHTCINGEYQQNYSLKMIEEVIENYQVDGIFFNMFGYQTSDYSGNDYGICHCDNCKLRFMDMFGLDLPKSKDLLDGTYKKYKEFQWITTQNMLDRIYTHVKRINPNIAISTYNDHKVDIIRKESNTKLNRPHPVWLYSASENVKSVEDTWDDKIISNCCINAVDLQYRFMGVSSEEVSIRLYENIASGSGLDYCIIGVLEGYKDRKNFTKVKEIFNFHSENERYFGRLLSTANVALIKPSGPRTSEINEYLGIFKILKEAHIQFDVICQHQLVQKESELLGYRLLIVPDVREWVSEQIDVLSRLQEQGVNLLATGSSFTGANQKNTLQLLFNAEYIGKLNDTDAAYLETSDKQIFPEFQNRDWVILEGEFTYIRFEDSIQKLLPLVSPTTFGPPERAYNHKTSEYFGAGIYRSTKRNGAYIPWQPGKLYKQFGYEDHKELFLNIMTHILDNEWTLQTDADSCVEVFYNRTAEGDVLLQFLNLSGFNGVTYTKPRPMGPIRISLKGIREPRKIVSLITKQEIEFEIDEHNAAITLCVNKLDDYEAIILENPN